MSETSLRKAYKYKLKPTPEQERVLAETLRRCRQLYNTALEQRITAYRRCGITLTCYQQQAELSELKAAFPEYADINAQVLQDVLTRLDKTYQAFFRRVRESKARQTPGFPRYQGRGRWHSFTYKQVGDHGGARLDNGFLVLSKVGRVAVRWSRPLEGTPKTVTISKEADGWYACISCAEVPAQPLPRTGQETGIDLGIESFATLADGTMIHNPRCYRRAERRLKTAQRKVARRKVARRKKGSNRRREAAAIARSRTSDGETSAARLPAQGSTCARAPVRHNLSRGLADSQPAQESPSRQKHCRRRVGAVLEYPQRQGSMGRASSRRRAACLHQPDLLWLRRCGVEGTLCPLSQLPGLRNQPAPRS
jgi:Helix-turn-helix domain/Probable transposase